MIWISGRPQKCGFFKVRWLAHTNQREGVYQLLLSDAENLGMIVMKERKNFWDRNAKIYDRFMRKDRAAYAQMYELLRPIVRHKTVLELATGTELAARLPDFRLAGEHSLTEGMAAFVPLYRLLNELPAVRNISNKIIVLEKM